MSDLNANQSEYYPQSYENESADEDIQNQLEIENVSLYKSIFLHHITSEIIFQEMRKMNGHDPEGEQEYDDYGGVSERYLIYLFIRLTDYFYN